MTGWKGLALDVLADAGVRHERGPVTVPYRDRDGRELYRKRFRRDGRSFYRPAGIELVPFGLETLPCADSRHPRYCALLLCEGDAGLVWQRYGHALPDEVARAAETLAEWRSARRLVVRPRDVVHERAQACDGRLVAEAAVWSAAIVVVEPAVQSRSSFA